MFVFGANLQFAMDRSAGRILLEFPENTIHRCQQMGDILIDDLHENFRRDPIVSMNEDVPGIGHRAPRHLGMGGAESVVESAGGFADNLKVPAYAS